MKLRCTFSLVENFVKNFTLRTVRMMEVMFSGTSSVEEHEEHTVGNLSLEVVGQGWSGWMINLFLEDWEAAGSSERCPLALDLLC